ncbi:MAG: hypothetical protein EBS53_06520 [Bacteroidetes bacterium]|nr:hypothetical protein [Bacteroidota bacterium]
MLWVTSLQTIPRRNTPKFNKNMKTIFQTQQISWSVSRLFTLSTILFFLFATSCARKTESVVQDNRKATTNPYTKKEYEKAKEINPRIPIEKQ